MIDIIFYSMVVYLIVGGIYYAWLINKYQGYDESTMQEMTLIGLVWPFTMVIYIGTFIGIFIFSFIEGMYQDNDEDDYDE